LLAGFALSGCQVTKPPTGTIPHLTQEVTLLLGFRPDVQFAAFYLAQQEGLFADAGLDVSIEHRDESDLIRLVADGQADLGVADATDVILGRSSGIPIRYVGTLYGHFPVALIGSPEVVPEDPSGLAGLRIGTPGRYGSSWVALLAMLAAGDLTVDDVTLREYPAFNQVEGLLNGDVDLITGFRTNEPLQLEARGRQVELLTVDEVAPLPGPGIVAGDELLAANPELATAFVYAVVSAEQTIARDPERGLQAAIQAVPTIGEDPETARSVLEATVELWGGTADEISGAIDADVWRDGYRTMVELGLVDGSVPVEEMYRSLAGSA
jgi:NitT/TauT family transport system substrate-binding protein